MRQKIFTSSSILFLCLQCALHPALRGQQYNCFKAPVLTIDFGTGRDVADINHLPLPGYQREYNMCPIDGYYSFVSGTSGCFDDDWLTFSEDHTLNDKEGNMMLINANRTGGIFLTTTISTLKGNTTYQLEAWMINVCNLFDNCPPLPPNIVIDLITLTGKKVAIFQTGPLPQGNSINWRRYAGTFVNPPDVTTLVLAMQDITYGGCGNDFALDDITVHECVKTTPVTKTGTKPVPKSTKKRTATVAKPTGKKIVKSQAVKKDSAVVINKKIGTDTPGIALEKIKEKPTAMPLPKVLLTRANHLIKRIEAPAGEIIIDLYDNGQIDGDTVSVYHNNELIVSGAGLSQKPISFKIKVDATQPHHELIMVANNLGSIPPNTSLMIITADNKRSELFISSSEQKNAKLVIDLKE